MGSGAGVRLSGGNVNWKWSPLGLCLDLASKAPALIIRIYSNFPTSTKTTRTANITRHLQRLDNKISFRRAIYPRILLNVLHHLIMVYTDSIVRLLYSINLMVGLYVASDIVYLATQKSNWEIISCKAQPVIIVTVISFLTLIYMRSRDSTVHFMMYPHVPMSCTSTVSLCRKRDVL